MQPFSFYLLFSIWFWMHHVIKVKGAEVQICILCVERTFEDKYLLVFSSLLRLLFDCLMFLLFIFLSPLLPCWQFLKSFIHGFQRQRGVLMFFGIFKLHRSEKTLDSRRDMYANLTLSGNGSVLWPKGF